MRTHAMLSNPKFVRGLVMTSWVLFLCSPFSNCRAEANPQAPEPPETEISRGPLSFTNLTGVQNIELGTRDRNGITWHEFTKTATGGNFTYHARGVVLSGLISAFSLHGLKTLLTGSNTPALIIPANGLTFKLVTNKTAQTLVFGGKIRIPEGTSTSITNPREIRVTGGSEINQVGSLAFQAASSDWSNARFDFEQIPFGLTANLRSITAISFALPLDTGSIVASNGRFQAVLPSLASRTFEFGNQTSMSQISKLKVDALTVTVGSKTTITSSRIQMAGEMVAIADSENRTPILVSGSLVVQGIQGSAEYSQEPATVHSLTLRGVRLKPPQEKGDSLHPTPVESRFIEQLRASSLTELQKQSINASLAELTAAGAAFDFTMNVPPVYVSKQIQDSSKQFGLKLGTPLFGRQELLAIAEPLNPIPQSPRLQYVVRIVPQLSDKNLILRFAVASGQLSDLNIPSTIPLSDLEASVQQDLKAAEANSSAAASQVSVDLPIEFTKQLNLDARQTDPATGLVVYITSTPATVSTRIVSSVLLVDETGLHLLGRLEVR